jgi:hypothetical protein
VKEQTLSHHNTINEKSQGNNGKTKLEEWKSTKNEGEKIVQLKSMEQQEG